jgi:putative SOS response-associated peptidase YedK
MVKRASGALSNPCRSWRSVRPHRWTGDAGAARELRGLATNSGVERLILAAQWVGDLVANSAMCNLYSMMSDADTVLRTANASHDFARAEYLCNVGPDDRAPVVVTVSDGRREILPMRWGFPAPPGRGGRRPHCNIRNSTSLWWKPWIAKPEHRCLVPVTSFRVRDYNCDPPVAVWFALNNDTPLFFFAGIWMAWFGKRGFSEAPLEHHLLFTILTCAPNEAVGKLRARSMPVLLLDDAQRNVWMTGSLDEARVLQRPAPTSAIHVITRARATALQHGDVATNRNSRSYISAAVRT